MNLVTFFRITWEWVRTLVTRHFFNFVVCCQLFRGVLVRIHDNSSMTQFLDHSLNYRLFPTSSIYLTTTLSWTDNDSLKMFQAGNWRWIPQPQMRSICFTATVYWPLRAIHSNDSLAAFLIYTSVFHGFNCLLQIYLTSSINTFEVVLTFEILVTTSINVMMFLESQWKLL